MEIQSKPKWEQDKLLLEKLSGQLGQQRRALDHHAIVSCADLTGKITYVNDRFCEISQYTREELLGQDHRIVNSGYHTKAFFENLWATIQRGEIWQGILRNKAKDGSFYWVKSTIVPFKDPFGNPCEYMAIRTDITEQKRVQDQLRLNYTALENAANVVMITDPQGIIQWVNPAFTTATGYAPAEAIGQTPRLLKSGKHNLTFYERLWSTILSGKVWRGETINKRKDGAYYFSDLTIAPVRGEDGAVTAFIGISQDITRRKDMERKLREQNRDLEKVNKELDRFVYTVSHDLRAPLRGILAFSNFLKEEYSGHLDAQGQEYLSEIREGTERMDAMLRDLLELSNISRIRNPMENISVDDLLADVQKALAFDIKARKVDIQIDAPMPRIFCDRIKLKIIFQNLIDNAVKFSPNANTDVPRVDVGGRVQGEFIEFYVKDNGIGIEPQFHGEIFGTFRKLHSDDEFKGRGMGLSIVKRILDEWGGTIRVESQKGRGTALYFQIPKNLSANLNQELPAKLHEMSGEDANKGGLFENS